MAGGPQKRLNVILDIDETFVQFVGTEDWDSLDPREKEKYTASPPGRSGLFILRPGFVEFFTFLKENCKTVNLWTWSDAEYAGCVKKLIEERVPGLVIANVWSDTDVDASIELHGHNKDLNYIWYVKKKFNPCDTILVDDLPANTQNPSNVKNGIQVFPFHPLGEKLSKKQKTATKIRTNKYTDLSNDVELARVIEILKKVDSAADFCKDDDLPFPFPDAKVKGGRKTRRRNPLSKPIRKTRKALKTKTRR